MRTFLKENKDILCVWLHTNTCRLSCPTVLLTGHFYIRNDMRWEHRLSYTSTQTCIYLYTCTAFIYRLLFTLSVFSMSCIVLSGALIFMIIMAVFAHYPAYINTCSFKKMFTCRIKKNQIFSNIHTVFLKAIYIDVIWLTNDNSCWLNGHIWLSLITAGSTLCNKENMVLKLSNTITHGACFWIITIIWNYN